MRKIQLVSTSFLHTFFAVIVFSVTLFIGACTTKDHQAFHSVPSQPFSTEYVAPPPVPLERAAIVVYRQPQDNQSGNDVAANLYINKMYQSSLLHGGMTFRHVCPGESEITLWANEGKMGRQQVNAIRLIADLAGGETGYYEIIDHDGKVELHKRSASEYSQAGKLRLQTHTIPRGIVACETPAPAPVIKGEIIAAGDGWEDEMFTLDAVGLFPLSSDAVEDIIQPGRDKIMEVARQVHTEYVRVDSVKVVGHADPTAWKKQQAGAIHDNEALSYARARAVAELLQANGVKAQLMHVEGKGAKNLVVTDCPAAPKTLRDSCNQPNRRVEIIITGQHRR